MCVCHGAKDTVHCVCLKIESREGTNSFLSIFATHNPIAGVANFDPQIYSGLMLVVGY